MSIGVGSGAFGEARIAREQILMENDGFRSLHHVQELIAARKWGDAASEVATLLKQGKEGWGHQDGLGELQSFRRTLESYVEQIRKADKAAFETQFEADARGHKNLLGKIDDAATWLQLELTHPLTAVGREALSRNVSNFLDHGDYEPAIVLGERLQNVPAYRESLTHWDHLRLAYAYAMKGDEAKMKETLSRVRLDGVSRSEITHIEGIRKVLDQTLARGPYQAPPRPDEIPVSWDESIVSNREETLTPLLPTEGPAVSGGIDAFTLRRPEYPIGHSHETVELGGVPALAPLIREKEIILRDSFGLRSLDRITGKTKWILPLNSSRFAQFKRGFETGPQALAAENDNYRYGTILNSLSSFHDEIYLVDFSTALKDAYLAMKPVTLDEEDMPRYNVDQPLRDNDPKKHFKSKLVAYRLHDDHAPQMSWELNGEVEGEWFGHAFLGAPAVRQGVLFTLSRKGETIYASALVARTGKTLWRSSIGLTNSDPFLPPSEGLTPYAYQGRLHCPLGHLIVSVDAANGELRSMSPLELDPMKPMRSFQVLEGQRAHWHPTASHPIFIDDKAYYLVTIPSNNNPAQMTGPGTPYLVATDLLTGKFVWVKELPGGAYHLGPRFEKRLVMTSANNGQTALMAFELDSGEVAWHLRLRGITGLGSLSGHRYLVGIEAHGAAEVDLRTGQLMEMIPNPQVRDPLLVVSDGALQISFGLGSVSVSPSPIERLKAELEKAPSAYLKKLIEAKLADQKGESPVAALREAFTLANVTDDLSELTRFSTLIVERPETLGTDSGKALVAAQLEALSNHPAKQDSDVSVRNRFFQIAVRLAVQEGKTPQRDQAIAGLLERSPKLIESLEDPNLYLPVPVWIAAVKEAKAPAEVPTAEATFREIDERFAAKKFHEGELLLFRAQQRPELAEAATQRLKALYASLGFGREADRFTASFEVASEPDKVVPRAMADANSLLATVGTRFNLPLLFPGQQTLVMQVESSTPEIVAVDPRFPATARKLPWKTGSYVIQTYGVSPYGGLNVVTDHTEGGRDRRVVLHSFLEQKAVWESEISGTMSGSPSVNCEFFYNSQGMGCLDPMDGKVRWFRAPSETDRRAGRAEPRLVWKGEVFGMSMDVSSYVILDEMTGRLIERGDTGVKGSARGVVAFGPNAGINSFHQNQIWFTVWNIENRKVVAQWKYPFGTNISVSADRRFAVVREDEGAIHILDLKDGIEKFSIPQPAEENTSASVAFSTDGVQGIIRTNSEMVVPHCPDVLVIAPNVGAKSALPHVKRISMETGEILWSANIGPGSILKLANALPHHTIQVRDYESNENDCPATLEKGRFRVIEVWDQKTNHLILKKEIPVTNSTLIDARIDEKKSELVLRDLAQEIVIPLKSLTNHLTVSNP